MSLFTPELSLVLEVLRRAVWDALAGYHDTTSAYGPGYRGQYNVFARQAEAWLTSRETEPWSCIWCCEMLGVSQQKVIDHIKELKSLGEKRGPGRKADYGIALQQVMDDDITAFHLVD